MKTLLVLDEKNYEDTTKVFEKFAVRGIILKNGKLAVQEDKYGQYKLLGGGVEKCETYEDALAREVKEEGGLLVKLPTIKEIGEIIEIRQDIFDPTTKYICHSLFYYCGVEEHTVEPEMTESEIRQGFHLSWVEPKDFLVKNAEVVDKPWVDRDCCFVKMLVDKEV